jgi:uncharacterized protein (TIGR03435 family)
MEGLTAAIVKRRRMALRGAGMAAAAMALISGVATAIHGRAEAQDGATTARVYKYEVVSVKPRKSGDSGGGTGTRSTRDGYIAENEPLFILLDYAYDLSNPEHLSGGPSWVYSDSERYDVEAKMDESVADELQKLSRDERTAIRRQMLQELLATRFNLKVHRETRDLPVYFLEIAKSGLKLKEAKADDPNAIKGPDGRPLTDVVDWGSGDSGTIIMTAHAVPISSLAGYLEKYAGHIVLDKTQLAGHYDFSMQFVPELIAPQGGGGSASSGADPGAPSMFTAIEKDLGLKLEPGRAPIDVVVIDHVERPSEN